MARDPLVLGESFDSIDLAILPGSILELPLKQSHPKFAAYIDIVTGERLLGDPRNSDPTRVLDFNPQTGIALASTDQGSWAAYRPDSTNTLGTFDFALSLRELKSDSLGKVAVAIGYTPLGGTLDVQAFNIEGGQSAWTESFPLNSMVTLSEDRKRVLAYRLDTATNTKILELYDAATGEQSHAYDLVANNVAPDTPVTPAYSKNGRYAFALKPGSTYLVDIEEGAATDLGAALAVSFDPNSRYATLRRDDAWEIISLSDNSVAFSQPASDGPPPAFSDLPDLAVYYDANATAIRVAHLDTTETEEIFALPDGFGTPNAFAITSDGRRGGIFGADERIHIYDFETSQDWTYDAPFSPVGSIKIDEPSDRLIVIGIYGSVATLPLSQSGDYTTLSEEGVIKSKATVEGGVIATLSTSGFVRSYNRSTGDLVDSVQITTGFNYTYFDFAVDATRAAYLDLGNNQFLVTDYSAETTVWSEDFNSASEGILDAAFSPSGNKLLLKRASGSGQSTVLTLEVRNLQTSATELSKTDSQAFFGDALFAAEESLLVVAATKQNKTAIRTYSLADASLVSTSPDYNYVGSISVNAAGSTAYFANGSRITSVDLATGAATVVLDLATLGLKGSFKLYVSPDESFALATDQFHTATYIDLETKQKVTQSTVAWVQNDAYFTDGSTETISILPDSQSFLHSSGDGTTSLWSILDQTGSLVLDTHLENGTPEVSFVMKQGRAYRIHESDDLSDWESHDPFNQMTADEDTTQVIPLTTQSQTFRQIVEYQ